ncbi:hypothetical protein EJB05_22288, partial [Eragrostis curvula]
METKQGLRLLCVLTLVLLQLFTTICHSNTDNDIRALLSFKSLIREDPLNALSSWNNLGSSTSNGTCRWTGVICGSRLSTGRVISLQLRGLGLVGTISPHLGNLTRLRVLDLSDNKLEGEIPPSLGDCLALHNLNLSTGTIPSSMGQLSKLDVLNIRKNNISGLIPSSFANLTVLTFFSISVNYVHGNIPQWLGNLTMLTELNIAGNMMSGHVPPIFSKLTSLEFISIASNKLEGAVHPSLFNLSSLELLNLGLNQLSGSLPPDMGFTLPNLRVFSIFYNKFEGQIPASISNISALQTFNIHGNRFQGRIPPNIGMNGLLTGFEVGNNDLQATGPRDWDFLTSLANCSNLWGINIQLNNLSGILPNTIANLSQELQYILVGGNQIAGNIPAGIGRYYKLSRLEFADNLFTGTIPSDIGKLSNLHELSLFQNRLHGEIPLPLGNMTQLNLLLLSTNYLEGRIPATLGNLSMLRSIDISNNLLTGKIPQEVISISSLTEVCNLSSNALSGPIPPQIGHLVNLVTVDLSSNKLSGEIPSTLGNCLELRALYLQGNLLSGQIPKDLSALRGIELLDLSDNRLSGPIPEFLESFQLLKVLNFSFNLLSGPVPRKGIFSNASSVSLESNGALCGGSIVFNFPACPSQPPESPAQRRHLLILIISIVGASVLIMICTAGCYCVKKLKSSPGGANRDQDSTLLNVIYQRISYAELYMATNSFSEENLIGQYGMGTEISKDGDVFSFGVLLLEILTGRRPTDSYFHDGTSLDSYFHDGTSLPKYVERASPDRLLDVVDRTMPHNGDTQEIIDLFVAPVSRLGLACCSVPRSQRISMVRVVKELSAIKKACEE